MESFQRKLLEMIVFIKRFGQTLRQGAKLMHSYNGLQTGMEFLSSHLEMLQVMPQRTPPMPLAAHSMKRHHPAREQTCKGCINASQTGV